MRDQTEIVAYHEAGHAVAALAAQIEVEWASIEKTESRLGGVKIKMEQSTETKSLQRRVIWLLGGMTGDGIHHGIVRGNRGEFIEGDKNDQDQARAILSVIGHSGDFNAYLGCTGRLLRRDNNVKALIRIAEALLVEKHIAAARLHEIAQPIDIVDDHFWKLLDFAREQFRNFPNTGSIPQT